MSSKLSKVKTSELINELISRGYTTDLLFCIEDVKRQLKFINEDLSKKDKIKLDEDDMHSILMDMNFEYAIEYVNNRIADEILNYNPI